MNNSCVYAHLKPNGDPFYIGKGVPNRPYRKDNRNKWWHNIVNKYGGYEVNIIESKLSDEQAIELEIFLISELRESGIKLCNLTDGGDGVSGFRHSQESRNRMKISNRGKAKSGHKLSSDHIEKLRKAKLGKKLSKEHRQKLSEVKKGRKFSKETCEKISKALIGRNISQQHKDKLKKPVICLDTNEYFDSVKSACEKYNLHRQNIAKACTGRLKKTGGLRFKYAEQELTS